jgi:hypothetical protein
METGRSRSGQASSEFSLRQLLLFVDVGVVNRLSFGVPRRVYVITTLLTW